jgi:uncharacterized protein YodC (DUF2158 family)
MRCREIAVKRTRLPPPPGSTSGGNRPVRRASLSGPFSTVVNYGTFTMGTVEGYQCRWFDAKNRLTSAVFSEAELQAHVHRRPRTMYAASTKGLQRATTPLTRAHCDLELADVGSGLYLPAVMLNEVRSPEVP